MRGIGAAGKGGMAAVLAAMLVAGGAGGVSAGPSIVVDYETGGVLHEEEARRPWYPASLSKLMTAYVVFQAIRDGRITGATPIAISAKAAKMAPSKMGYPAGTLVTVDDALKMLIVHSANDIAVALAEGVSGSVDAFAAEMNAASRRLGMTESHWVNPNGLPDPGQVSSARDMAVLATALLKQFPDYAPLYSIQAIQSGKRVMRTHNALVYRYPGADGMKTGFICAGGFNLVATAQRGGRRLVTVVMGSPSAKERTNEAVSLFEANFASAGSGGGLFGSVASGHTLDQLAASSHTLPPDIRDIACNRKRGGAAAAESEDTAEVTPPPAPASVAPERSGSVLLPTMAAAAPVAAAIRGPEDALLTSWTLAPPVPVGPYVGPLKPRRATPAVAPETAPALATAAPVPAATAAPGAIGYADPASPPAPAPGAIGAPLALPGPAPGAIRPGAKSTAPAAPLPGQIPRAATPLAGIASDPLSEASPAPQPAAPLPPVRPKKKPKPAAKSAPQT